MRKNETASPTQQNKVLDKVKENNKTFIHVHLKNIGHVILFWPLIVFFLFCAEFVMSGKANGSLQN